MPIVGIDMGHGGRDPGAVGSTGLHESDVNLIVGKLLDVHFQRHGVKTIFTRSTDEYIGFTKRIEILNNSKCDLVISIHCNASENRKANYVSTFIYETAGEAQKLAQSIQENVTLMIGWPDGGVRAKNLFITRQTKAPAVLIEMGFISNLSQEQQLRTAAIHENFAIGIAMGILKYLNIPYKLKPASSCLIIKREPKICIGDQVIDCNPCVTDGVMVANVRPLVESLGFGIKWDDANKIATINKGDK